MRVRWISFSVAVSLAAVEPSFTQKVDVYNRPVRVEPSSDFNALHYRIKIKLDDKAKSFQAENTVTLTPFKDDFKKCTLDAETFTVSGVEDEHSRPLRFEQLSHQLVVYFPLPYHRDDTVRFTVSYHAENLLDSTGQSRGVNFMRESTNRPAQMFTQSFPRGARHWFPCYDQPHDKATQEVIATVRGDYQLLSNGKLVHVAEDRANGTKTFHWRQDLPHSTYLSTIVAGPYELIHDSLRSLPVTYWVYKGDVKFVESTFPRTPEIIKLFEQEYGYKFPWAKYDQVTIAGVGGGAECTSASMLGQGMMHDQRAEQDFSSYSWLICHEAAHQWWGDLITCRDWTHTWLNESFGSYSEVMYALYDKGEQDAAVNILGKKNQYLQEAHTRYMRPIVFDRWNEPGDNFDRHTYQKGAVLLDHLRWILGEKPFHALLSYFLKKHAFQPADTHDFMTAVKEATGQNLDWFFEDWFFKPGHPVFEIQYSWDERLKKVILTVIQSQDTTGGVPIFRTPVVIKIETSGGSTATRVWLSKQKEIFEFPCAQKPLLVRFDEGNHLLKEWTFKKSSDELMHQLKHDDVVGRMWAISELVKRIDERRVIEELVTSAQSDSFWAVRRDAVYRLGGFRGTIQMDLDRNLIPQTRLDSVQLIASVDRSRMSALFKNKALDENSQVRAAALYGLGNLKTKEDAGFLKDRFERDDSYVAQAAALRALGKCGDASIVSLLKIALTVRSPRNVIGSAAEWALARISQKD